MTSTIERGNGFRDLVASMLEAAGFVAETETREGYKKADVRWRREDIDGTVRYLVEAKDYSGTLGMPECRSFKTEYGGLVEEGRADKAWLISRRDISPDGRDLVNGNRNLRAMTFSEFQRRLLGVDAHLQNMVATFEAERIEDWYVRPHTTGDEDLEDLVRTWLDEPDALPLAVVAGYGKGKSTFARRLTAALAREAMADPTRRVPVLVPLGSIVDEQALEGLLGKVFTTGPRVRGYNFSLFLRLNEAGRFVVVFDGFDEMKHGMTPSRFEAEIVELMRLDRGAAKVMVLGRDTAFHDDVEFRSIIHGRQRTAGGNEVPSVDRRPFRQVGVRDFTLEEARGFVERFFPMQARDALRGGGTALDGSWIEGRTAELLSGQFDQLLVRPVHAQMLCEIATDRDLLLADLSIHGLFDRFVHFLIAREVRKRGRDPRFPLTERRRFNAELALWLWRQGGISTVSLAAVPASICRGVVEDVSHDLNDDALRRELIAGCLIEKSRGTIYFSHRSLQEFLVAEALVATWASRDGGPVEVIELLRLATPEVARFVVDAARTSDAVAATASRWIAAMSHVRRADVPRAGFGMLVDLASIPGVVLPRPEEDPWFAWLAYFVANRGVEFTPRDEAASSALLNIFRGGLAGTRERVAGVLLLAAQALMADSDQRRRIAPAFAASWLDPQALREAIRSARARGRGEFHYVSSDKDLAFWSILKASRVERTKSEARLVIDLGTAVRSVRGLLRIGLSSEDGAAPSAGPTLVEVPVQALYRAWGLREAELERVRPFFGDDALRAKIRAVEVEIVGARRAPSGAAS